MRDICWISLSCSCTWLLSPWRDLCWTFVNTRTARSGSRWLLGIRIHLRGRNFVVVVVHHHGNVAPSKLWLKSLLVVLCKLRGAATQSRLWLESPRVGRCRLLGSVTRPKLEVSANHLKRQDEERTNGTRAGKVDISNQARDV